MNVIFMGSSRFGLPTLNRLKRSYHKIIAVCIKLLFYEITDARKNQNLAPLLTKHFSLKASVSKRLINTRSIRKYEIFNCDIVIVIAYGLLIPEQIIRKPKYGSINIHPSNLPRWRGAAPIHRAILAGDNRIAICVIKIDRKLDAGNIIFRKKLVISSHATFEKLNARCAELSSKIVYTLDLLSFRKRNCIKQIDRKITYAVRVRTREMLLNFTLTAYENNNKIRAFSKVRPYFVYQKEKIKVIKAKQQMLPHCCLPGIIIKKNLAVICDSSIFKVLMTQRKGKKISCTQELLQGFDMYVGTRLNI